MIYFRFLSELEPSQWALIKMIHNFSNGVRTNFSEFRQIEKILILANVAKGECLSGYTVASCRRSFGKVFFDMVFRLSML